MTLTASAARKENYDLFTDEALSSLRDGELLLHCCCGPCATAVVERITRFTRPVLYYYNPNIMPPEEWDRRLSALKEVAKRFSAELIVPDNDCGAFTEAARGLEEEREGGARCAKCIGLRLASAADYAAKNGFKAFCTTLSVSPHKSAPLINALGRAEEERTGAVWIPSDFKKRDGYRRSVELCREWGIYRQSYCGCDFGRAYGEK